MFKQARQPGALALLVAAAMLAGPALAQAPAAAPAVSPAKKELVAKVLELQKPALEALGQQLAEQPARLLMQQAGNALQRVPEDRREALARDIEADVRKYVEETAPLVRNRAVRLAPSTIGALLEERMTEEELREVIGILQSPANRKFQGLAADMQRSIGEKLVTETRGEVEPKVRTLEQTVTRRLQAAAPAAPAQQGQAAPRPAPAPAAAPAKKP